MQCSIVTFQDIKKTPEFRFEPDYFLPRFLKNEKILSNKRIIFLSQFAKFLNGPAFSSEEFSPEGDIYVAKIGDVTNKREFPLWEKISEEHFEKLKGEYLLEKDILMTLTGDPPDVGKVQFIFNPPKKELSWNQRVGRIRIEKTDEIISSEALHGILSSRYCREYVERNAKGIRQRNVGNPAILNMPIPVFEEKFQKFLSKIIHKSFCEKEKAILIFQKTGEIILSELGVSKLTQKNKKIIIKPLSTAEAENRIDPEFFQSKYDEIEKSIKNYYGGCDKLGELVDIKDKKFTPVENKEYSYLELGSIGNNGEIINCQKDLGKNLPTRARRIVKKNDVIVSSIEGSLEKVALIRTDYDLALCSTGFFVINSEKINSETLLVFLKSIVGQLQLKKRCRGTILSAINKNDMGKILVPKINSSIQEEIKGKIRKSDEFRKKAKLLLEIAKKGVEIAIEQDEDNAEKWIDYKLEKLGLEI